MRRRMAACLVSLALAAGSARGASFLDRPWGTPEAGLSTRSRAMGGTGVAAAQEIAIRASRAGAACAGG